MIGPLAPALRLQSTIVHALIMQDLNRRAAQSRFGVLVALTEPLILVVLLFVIRFFLAGTSKIHGMPLILFLLTGLLPYFSFRFTVAGVAGATQRRSAAMMFPQVTTLDTILAQAIASCTIYATVLLIAFTTVAALSGYTPSDYLYVICSTVLILLLACNLGLMMGVLIRFIPAIRLFVGLILRVEMFFSGAFFLATEIPGKMIKYISWNPTFHAIEMMREGWFPGYISPVADPIYVLKILIFFLAIGLSLERITSARIPG